MLGEKRYQWSYPAVNLRNYKTKLIGKVQAFCSGGANVTAVATCHLIGTFPMLV